jgi:exodeoxyribonuclease-3
MLLATWNVNSIRARDARLRAWLQAKRPDVLCLQELKCEVERLPKWLAEEGWHVAATGQKTYNGVAILSRSPLTDVRVGIRSGLPPSPSPEEGALPEQARIVAATVEGVRVVSAYVPNGGDLGSDKWTYKLGWLAQLRAWLDRVGPAEKGLALCGDFNVAPEARDVHDPAAWEGTVLYCPEARAAIEDVRAHGLVDAFRRHEQGTVFSWWDYRQGSFRRDRGLRIDHVWTTPDLAQRSTRAEVDKTERAGEGPSDHAPVMVWFE